MFTLNTPWKQHPTSLKSELNESSWGEQMIAFHTRPLLEQQWAAVSWVSDQQAALQQLHSSNAVADCDKVTMCWKQITAPPPDSRTWRDMMRIKLNRVWEEIDYKTRMYEVFCLKHLLSTFIKQTPASEHKATGQSVLMRWIISTANCYLTTSPESPPLIYNKWASWHLFLKLLRAVFAQERLQLM